MSAILSSDDLNDFITPGVACIKPVENLPKQYDLNPYEVTTEDRIQRATPAPASISLTDCLACSGCVTSAETILISLQSHTEVLNTLDRYTSLDVRRLVEGETHPRGELCLTEGGSKLFVASVSPQVRASLAATYGVTEREAGYMLEQFLGGSQGLRIGGRHNNGFTYVVDTNRMREACLVLGADEIEKSTMDNGPLRPVLTSSCPGWICYAEKTHPHVLPHLSQLKSPQALTGTLLKSVLSRKLGIHPSQIWHLAIMPCFDKKLEASREELRDLWWQNNDVDDKSSTSVRDVDCVITSRELLTLANDRGVRLSQMPRKPIAEKEQVDFPDSNISKFLFPIQKRGRIQLSEAGSSGGYLYHIMKSRQAQYPSSTISAHRGRNADVVEYTLFSVSQEPLLKCARFYGFRNIQNLVRKLKPPKSSKLPGAARRNLDCASGVNEYAYVEVMACPGGCTNGGGQIKVEDVVRMQPQGKQQDLSTMTPSQKEWLGKIDEAYYSADSESDVTWSDEETEKGTRSAPVDLLNGISPNNVHAFLEYWAASTSIPLECLVYTTYRKVESDVGKRKPKSLGDSERIAAIAGLNGGGW